MTRKLCFQRSENLKNTDYRLNDIVVYKADDKLIVDRIAKLSANEDGTNALYVKEARVDAGPVMKRHMFDSRSHIGHRDHRTSHIIIVVATKN